MITDLRRLGTCLIVIFGALASTASAANFHSEIPETQVTAAQTTPFVFKFTSTNFNFSCAIHKLSGTQKGTKAGSNDYTAASVELHPVFEQCKLGGNPMKVETTGCNYKFSAASKTSGSMSIVCSSGKEIIADLGFAGCTIKFPSQMTGSSTIDYANGGTGTSRNVSTTFTVSGLKYSVGGSCSVGSGSDGTLQGTVLGKGFSDPSHVSQVGIWVE